MQKLNYVLVGAVGACASLLCEDGDGATVCWGELVVESSSMIAPFALQRSNCFFVSPWTPHMLVPSNDRAASGLALLRSAPLRYAPLRLAALRLAPLRS